MKLKFPAVAKLVLGTIAVGLVGVLIVLTYELVYWQKIIPGVHIGTLDVSNLSWEEAKNVVESQNGKRVVNIQWETNSRQIDQNTGGWSFDAVGPVNEAMSVGRSGNWAKDMGDKWLAWSRGKRIELQYRFDETKLNQVVAGVAHDIDIPAREPQILLDKNPDGNYAISISAGENGQVVDDKQLIVNIKLQIANGGDEILEVPIRKLTPKLNEGQIASIKSRAEKLVQKKLVLTLDQEKWEIGGEELVGWLDPTSGRWKQTEIERYVDELAKSVDRPAQNAYFKFLSPGRVEEFKPAVAGRAVEKDETTAQLIAAEQRLEGEETEISMSIPVTGTPPAINNENVNNLGIKELIGRGDSRFTGSIANRVFNIKHAAENLDGILIAPGEEFSFDKNVGDISVAGGFRPGYIIKDGKTILGDGGGVCQVSSTMFRAALNSGLPITERWAHAYRVSYYEQDIGPGYDATIFTPSVDLKFRNDTGAYILIQTKLDAVNYKLAFEFYGTSDGRKVEYSKTKVWDRTAPPPDVYIDDPTLPKGTVKQTEHSIWGSKVSFDWTVTRGTEVLQKRTWYSNFAPWQGVYMVGTR